MIEPAALRIVEVGAPLTYGDSSDLWWVAHDDWPLLIPITDVTMIIAATMTDRVVTASTLQSFQIGSWVNPQGLVIGRGLRLCPYRSLVKRDPHLQMGPIGTPLGPNFSGVL